MDVWRLRPSGGSPERVTTQHLAVNFLAPLDPRTLLYVARAEDRSGPWLWALDVESGVSHARAVGRRSIHVGVGQSRRPAHRRHRRQPQREPVARAAARSARRRSRRATRTRCRRRRVVRFAPRFGEDVAVLSVRPRDGRRTLEGPGRTGVGGPEGRGRGVVRTARGVAGRTTGRCRRQTGGETAPVDHVGGRHERTDVGPVHRNRGAAGQGAADWSPDGTRIVTGGRDAKGPALFMIPVDGGGAPVRLVEGKWVNPVWSPNGDLIVYAGRSVDRPGRAPWRATGDGTPVELPHVLVRPGGYRFLPDGSGLVYLQRIQALDFWLLDLATRHTPSAHAPRQSGRPADVRHHDLTGSPSCSTARGRTRISS